MPGCWHDLLSKVATDEAGGSLATFVKEVSLFSIDMERFNWGCTGEGYRFDLA
jgi:hypothetical protein